MIGRQVHRDVFERTHGIHAAGAADAEITFVLVIQVDEGLARDEVLFHGAGAVESRLLGNREQTFHARMRQRVIVQDGHRRSHADAVVGTERRVVGNHPAVFDHIVDRIFGEVEIRRTLLLAHHVGMALEDNRRMIFIALGGRLGNHHVAHFVGLARQAARGRELLQVGDNLFLMSGFAGNPGDFLEETQNFFCIHTVSV